MLWMVKHSYDFLAVVAMVAALAGAFLNFRHVYHCRQRPENCWIFLKGVALAYITMIYGFVVFDCYGFSCAETARPYFRPAMLMLLVLAVCDAWIREADKNKKVGCEK